MSLMDQFKSDGVEAAYRVAATQLRNVGKQALLGMLKDQKLKKNSLSKIGEVLDTELGDALMDAIFGAALTFVPGVKEDPRAQQLAKQFRVSAMSVAGNVVMGELVGTLVPALTTALNSLPEPTAHSNLPVPEEILPEKKLKEVQEEKEVLHSKKSRHHG